MQWRSNIAVEADAVTLQKINRLKGSKAPRKENLYSKLFELFQLDSYFRHAGLSMNATWYETHLKQLTLGR